MEQIPEATPRVLAVVVTHNGEEWLAECLGALARQMIPSLDVIVVDSGSRVTPAPLVNQILPRAEFVRIEENVGFGTAANKALELSDRAPEADYYLFMHDDVVADPEAVSLLVASALMTEAGIIGGKGVDWDRPDVIVEVGMSADQFGYPFSGLEIDEIDQGQHDTRKETLYVSNALMLVSRGLIERCGLWDGTYFAFSEDLDLCLRARLAGFRVAVQPAARYRHAQGLVTGRRPSRLRNPIRFFTRRNRLRTIAKNVAAYRMPVLLLLNILVGMAEVLVLAALRKFNEIPAYPKAVGSFLATFPDVMRRRRAIQKRRAVPDRRLRSLMVSDFHRARVFFERRLRDLERGTLAFGTRTLSRLTPAQLKASFVGWIRKPQSIAYVLLSVLLVFAARGVLFGEAVAAGGVWPFPQQTRSLLTEFLSSWHEAGLGTDAAAPPALFLLWLVSVVTGGSPGASQRLLVLLLLLVGVLGVARLVARRTPWVPARIVAALLYALGPVTKLIVTSADLGAMALYAALPYMIEIAFRTLGPTPYDEGDRAPTPYSTDTLSRDLLRLGLLTAGVQALAPSAWAALLLFWVSVGVGFLITAWDRGEVRRRWRWVVGSILVGWVLLIPWSFEALRPSGAALGPVFSGLEGTYTPLWEGGIRDLFLLSPGFSLWSAVVTIGVLIGGLVLPGQSRRREGRVFVGAWMAFAVVGAAVAKGYLPALVSSKALWLVSPLCGLAILGGHFVAGIGEQLPKHAFGWRHLFAPAVSILVLAGISITWLPSLGDWGRPQDSLAASTGELGRSISSYLVSTEQEVGEFRVLWLGDRWVDPIRSGARRMDGTPFLITTPSGLTMLDIHEPPPNEGERKLDQSVEAMLDRRLHLSGHLLAPASIRFIVVDPSDEPLMSALRRQRDIALEQQQGGIAVFRNLQWLPQAVLAPVTLARPVTTRDPNSTPLMLAEWSGGRRIPRRSLTAFRGELPRTRHSQVLLGQNYSSAWNARVEGRDLEQAQAFGWANRFVLPPDARGEIRISYSRRWLRFLWLLLEFLIVLIAVLIARGGRREVKRAPA